MMTFLPMQNYRAIAQCLDYKRLGKQRIEAKQILEVLVFNTPSRWSWHPVFKLWRGHEFELCKYGQIMCEEWKDRGYKDTTLPFFQDMYEKMYFYNTVYKEPVVFSEDLYASHRAALLAKDYEHYSQLGWKEKPVIKYLWKDMKTN